MQTNKQCTFHAGTDCVYTELEPCLRQTKFSWYPALSIRTDIKHTTEFSINKSWHSITHHQLFPAAVRLQAGRDPRQAMATNLIIKKLASVKCKIHTAYATRKAHDIQYCGQNPILLIRTSNYTLLFNMFKNSYFPGNDCSSQFQCYTLVSRQRAVYPSNAAVVRISE